MIHQPPECPLFLLNPLFPHTKILEKIRSDLVEAMGNNALPYRAVTRHAVLVESHDNSLKLSFYSPLCYDIRVHCPLLQYLSTKSAILSGAYSYFVVSFKCEGEIWLNPQPSYFNLSTLHMLRYLGRQNNTLSVMWNYKLVN